MTTSDRLDEVTVKEILKDIDPRTLRKSKGYHTRYTGVTKDHEVIFTTPSQVTPGVDYTQRVKLKDFDVVKDDDDLTIQEKVRLALTGDVSVTCSCPAYLWWGYEYIMTELDANNGPDQTIFPQVRNPQLQGTVCKHLKTVLSVLPNNFLRISSDIRKGNYL